MTGTTIFSKTDRHPGQFTLQTMQQAEVIIVIVFYMKTIKIEKVMMEKKEGQQLRSLASTSNNNKV